MQKRFLDKIKDLYKIKYAEITEEEKSKEKPRRITKNDVKRRMSRQMPELLEDHVKSLAPKDKLKQFDKWFKEIKSYSLKELEAIIIAFCTKLHTIKAYDFENNLYSVFRTRKWRLNAKFKYTKQNIEKLLWVNKKLMECFEKSAGEAEKIRKQFKRRKKKKDLFLDDIETEIKITPFLLKYDKKGKYWQEYDSGIYAVLQFVIDDEISLRQKYSSLKKYRESLHGSKEDSWNVEGLGSRSGKRLDCDPKNIKDNVFANDYICYAMHELYDHSLWSLQDIIKIEEFWAEVKVRYQHFSEKKYGI
ncbi:MAG: hypothetical protein LBL00_09320 [Endomicrobium sp.]|jgi:hypothetical protein|nr:hypothetical protein [Endomicrobium sp.]